MMQKIQEIQVETSDWRFNIEVFQKDGGIGYVAEYWGTNPKVPPSPPVGEPAETLRASSPKPIVLEGSEPDQLVAQCKNQIIQKFGPIEAIQELDVA